MKKVKVGKSKIHGNGLFADEPIKRGDVIELVHTLRELEPGVMKTTPTLIGRNYNHSDEPNSLNVIDGNNRYLVALKEIDAGGEITTNYRTNPELEQPDTFDSNDNYISFDYDDTLTTPEGFKLAQQMNKEGKNLYVITARDKVTPQMIERAEAAGIPKENIIPAGSDQEKVRIIKENNINKHIDNKDTVIKALGDKGELFATDKYPEFKADFIEMDLTNDDLNKLKEGGFIIDQSEDLEMYSGGGTSRPPKWSLAYNPYAYNAGNVVGGYEGYGNLTSQNLQLSTPDLFGREKKLNATRFPFSISAGRMYDKDLSNDYGIYGKVTKTDGYGNYDYKTPQEILDSKTTPFAGGIPLDAEISFGVEGSGLNPNMKKRSRLGAQFEAGYNPTTGIYGQFNSKSKWALGNNYNNELNKSGEWRVEPYVSPLNFQAAQKPTHTDLNNSYDQYLQGLVDSGSSYNPLDPNNPLQQEKNNQVEGKIFASTGAGADAQVKLPLGMLDAGIGLNYNLQAGQGQKFTPTAHLGYKIALDELGNKINLPQINLPERSPFRSMSAANDAGTRYDNSLFEEDAVPQGSVGKANASPIHKRWQPEAEDIFIDWKNQPSNQTFIVDPSTGETEEETNNYSKGGITKFPNGGEPKGRKKTQFQPGTYDPNETAGYMLDEQEVTVKGQASNWGKARTKYKEKHPEEQFINKKKREYLKHNKNLIIDKWGTKTGYGNKNAISSYNWPDYLVDNFKKEYDYKTNTAVVKNVSRKEGWNPNKRTQYIDNLNDTQRGIVAESKYGSKLQPTYWDRTLAGLATFASKFSPELRDAMNKGNMPGLTKKESQEILNAKMTKVPFTDIDLPFSIPVGGLESFSALEIPGTFPANYLKNTGLSTGSSYKEMPSWYSGEKMANVTDTDVTALNPLTYAGLEAIPELGINLAKGTYKLGKTGINALETGYEAAKVNPQSWFQTSEQLLDNPNLYRTVKGETTWKDPLGKLNKFVDDSKIKSSLKRENELIDKYPGFENRKVRIPLQQEEQNLRFAIEKAAEERNLRRSRLPIKPILNESGIQLGGGQGRLYMNTLDPTEVVKLGTFPGTSTDLQNLVEAGKNLEGMPLMENVAFPTKGFTIDGPSTNAFTNVKGNSEAVQFMPWKGNPLNTENPVNIPFDFGIPSDRAKRELQFMAQTLDDNKVGIDYFGQNNMMYDPKSDSYKLVDLNYVDDPKSAFEWNKLDKPVKQRIEDKFGYEIPEGNIPLELDLTPKQIQEYPKVPRELPNSSNLNFYRTRGKIGEGTSTGLTDVDIQRAIDRNIEWITSPEYARRRAANTGESLEEIQKSTDKIIKAADKATYKLNTSSRKMDFYGAEGMMSKQKWWRPAKVEISSKAVHPVQTLEHEVKHLHSPAIFDNRKIYENYPAIGAEDYYLTKGPEQQVRHLNAREQILEKNNLPLDAQLSEDQVADFIEEWRSKMNKRKKTPDDYSLHEDYDDLWSEQAGLIQKDMLRAKYNTEDLDFIGKLPTVQKIRFMNEYTDRLNKVIRSALNNAWMTVPVAGGMEMINSGTPEQRYGGSINKLKKFIR